MFPSIRSMISLLNSISLARICFPKLGHRCLRLCQRKQSYVERMSFILRYIDSQVFRITVRSSASLSTRFAEDKNFFAGSVFRVQIMKHYIWHWYIVTFKLRALRCPSLKWRLMSAMASQITSLTIAYSSVYLGADQRNHQSSASLAFVRGIHRWPVNSPRKGPVTWKMFPFDDVIILLKIRGWA